MAVAFVVYLIVEIAAIWAVASAVGALWTIVLLIGGAVVGSWLARKEGGKAFRALLAAAQAGRSGHQEVTDGMLIALGGLFIFLPGFVTDLIGLLMIVPPTRSVLRRRWLRRLQQRAMAMRTTHRVVVVDSEVADRDDRADGAGDPPDDQNPDDRPRIIEG